ncbi:hypothetical protein, partial [Rudaea sp.]|uniref:hypothetical protein n=1 Tax=Rudaea sp. TaxID=2136325 RepID=UPI002ED53D84
MEYLVQSSIFVHCDSSGKLADGKALAMAQAGIYAGTLGGGVGMSAITARTDWQALIPTLLVPALVVAGLVRLALQPQWDDSADWLDGLVVLILFEGVRVLVLRILRDTLNEYRGPWQAVKFFLLSMLILAGICLVLAVFAFKWQIFSILADPHTWKLVLPPLALIVADGVVNVAFFRGDAQRAAAQLDAAADDAEDWLALAVFPTPLLVALAYALLFFLHTRGVSGLSWLPSPSLDTLREISLLYAAFYFCGKAVVLAHVHTAHFLRTGKRLLGGRIAQLIVTRSLVLSKQNALGEQRSAARRLAVLQGAPIEPEESAT